MTDDCDHDANASAADLLNENACVTVQGPVRHCTHEVT